MRLKDIKYSAKAMKNVDFSWNHKQSWATNGSIHWHKSSRLLWVPQGPPALRKFWIKHLERPATQKTCGTNLGPKHFVLPDLGIWLLVKFKSENKARNPFKTPRFDNAFQTRISKWFINISDLRSKAGRTFIDLWLFLVHRGFILILNERGRDTHLKIYRKYAK